MTPKYCGCQSSVRIATALADLDSAAVRRVHSVTSARGAEVDARIDQERRRRLSAFLLNRRQRVNSNAVRVGTYARPESRIGRPLTQEEVAEALEVSRQWYAALERGLSIRPSAALLDRIATLFDLHGDDRRTLFRLAIPELGLALLDR
jgi:DNA-binding XRE family transcriptional regulator